MKVAGEHIKKTNLAIIPRENILRAIEKDHDFIDILTGKIIDILENLSECFNSNILNISFFTSDKIESLAKFFLYSISYLYHKDKQTPGEEYCEANKNFNLLKLGSSKKSLIIYILFHSLGNLFTKYFYERFSKVVNKYQNSLHLSSLNPKNNNILADNKLIYILNKFIENYSLPNYEDVVEKLTEYELMQFFIVGKYQNILDLLFNVIYRKFKKENDEGNPNKSNSIFDTSSFKFLGSLILMKNIWEIILKIKSIYQLYKKFNFEYEKKRIKKKEEVIIKQDNLSHILIDNSHKKYLNFKVKKLMNIKNRLSKNKELISNDDKEENFQVEEEILNKNCLLCSETITKISSTLCGHLFCWDCIIKYLQINNNCPFCRKICLPQNVIKLRSFG